MKSGKAVANRPEPSRRRIPVAPSAHCDAPTLAPLPYHRNMPSLFSHLQRLLNTDARSRWIYDRLYYSPWITRGCTYFNLGIAPVDPAVEAAVAPFERHQAQVYHEIIKVLSALGACEPDRALEVGFGLGGGLKYLQGALPTAAVLGIDLSRTAARRAQALCNAPCAVADAHHLPFAAASFDLLVAVECLHKLDMARFFSQASLVLRNQGMACVADFRAAPFSAISQQVAQACTASGLINRLSRDLTDQVLQASADDHLRQQKILSRIPWGFRRWGRELMAMAGSERHASFLTRQRCYFLHVAQKPAC